MILEGNDGCDHLCDHHRRIGGFLLAHSVTVLGTGKIVGWLSAIGMYVAALTVGSSTIWLGVENPLTLAVAAGGMGVVFLITKTVKVLEPTAAE